ncbi:MAG: FAD-dependent oxidoreductase [Mariprofundus sp.]|nr:FAD-dependent oxidoreductase [Mariprofundus sp.]
MGGGVCGLTAALRLAENGFEVELFEAAPQPGGRTRSFIDKKSGELCDNGPHLLNGAYQATEKLLDDCQAADHVTWQASLKLPLWEKQRQFFSLNPSVRLPFPLALLLSVQAMPGHSWCSALAMLRLHRAINSNGCANYSVASLLNHYNIPDALVRDMIEPICLGAMNESIQTADTSTFARVLAESFASRKSARLGWFNAPLQQALITPLVNTAERLGVIIHTRHSVQSVQARKNGVTVDDEAFEAAVIALPAYASNRLLGQDLACETRAITNVHLWYRQHAGLPEPFIGGIGTLGQWFFDVSAQMGQINPSVRHLCAVISAVEVEKNNTDSHQLVDQINRELAALCGVDNAPIHTRIVCEKRATVLVRACPRRAAIRNIVNASESPVPGELPATIEFAVQRGEKAAQSVKKLFT